jgi:hypothetical protein
MSSGSLSLTTSVAMPHLLWAGCEPNQGISRVYTSTESSLASEWGATSTAARILIRPQVGFYVMRLRRGAPLVPAIIYQLCPMVIPQPMNVTGPHPDDWCRPLDRSPRFEARLDGTRVEIDRVWTARSLRRVSRVEFEFRSGPLRRWARENPSAPEATPHRSVDLSAIPPLF